MFSTYLVSPRELQETLTKEQSSNSPSKSKTITLCASWFLPNDPQKRTGKQVFEAGHIPRARFFDLDKIADTSSPYPHMLPSAETFAQEMGNLGVSRDDTVVVYDSAELGIFSAPRVAWTLKVFGHPSVHLLNNFKVWVEQGLPLEKGKQDQTEKTVYVGAYLDKDRVVAFEEVRDIAAKQKASKVREVQILDARSAGRWTGSDAEPRPGLSSGHIPSSISIPMGDLLDPSTKAFCTAHELRAYFDSKGILPDKAIVSSCGTGVSAAVIDTALQEAGFDGESRRIYDGSWTEWAQRVRPDEDLIHKSV